MTAPATNPPRSWWRTLTAIIVATVAQVFWAPIRDGSPRWAAWPPGLRTIAVLSGVVYVICTVLVLASTAIRATDPLIHHNGDTYPAWATTVLLWATALVLTLALTAALHVHPLVQIVGVVFVGVALFVTAIGSEAGLLWATLAIIGLVVWFGVRARRRFAWFEFPVVLGLVLVGVYGPLTTSGFGAGVDVRPLFLGLLLGLLATLSLPLLVMAGYAPAEISVTLSEWLLNRISIETSTSRWRPIVLGLALAAGLVVLIIDVGSGLRRQEWDYRPAAWAASALVVGISVAGSGLMLRNRPGDPPRGPTAWAWERPAWILSVAWVAVALPVWLALLTGAIVSLLGYQWLFLAIQEAVASEWVFGAWRIVLCVVAFIWLVGARRRGERVIPVLLVCFITMTGLGASRLLTEHRVGVPWTLPTVVAWGVGVCLVAALVAVIRRRGIERQLWIALLGLLLSALVGRREWLAEPGSLAAGVSGLVVLVFGLVWRVLTDAGITRGDSRWFPLPSRVLLFAANALLGALVLAHLALTRQEDPMVDVEGMAMVGINAVGSPLVLGAIVLGLVSTLGLAVPEGAGRGSTLPKPQPRDKTVNL